MHIGRRLLQQSNSQFKDRITDAFIAAPLFIIEIEYGKPGARQKRYRAYKVDGAPLDMLPEFRVVS